MEASGVLYAVGYTVVVLLGCYGLYTLIVRCWRSEGETLKEYKLPRIALSISRKPSCCSRESFQKIVREQINNDENVRSVSPLGPSMFIIEIDLRDFHRFESEYGSVVNIVGHFINLRIPNAPLPKAKRHEETVLADR
jgi:hypothetical protein